MPFFLSNILTLFKSIEQLRAAQYDDTIRALELIYFRIMNSQNPTLSDTLSATTKIAIAFVFRPEFYLLISGISLLIFTGGSFSEPGLDYGPLRPVLFAVVGVVAGLIPLSLSFVTIPLHLLLGTNIWLLTGINSAVSALIFSALEPQIAKIFLDSGIVGFLTLALPMLVFYSMAEFYLLFRMNNDINFQLYKTRHSSPSIEGLIPAHKRGTLISMSSQDHYVEIVTKNGNHLERLTMTMAIELAPKAVGLQVHRSHWVAYKSILGLEKTGERYAVLLQNGARIPVGKSRVAEVRSYLDSR